MNLSQFFEHWRITENPFRGEEARHDDVFARLRRNGAGSIARGAVHSDFEKILGDLAHPSSAVVFGEKGSGKTAIRMQIAEAVAEHNARHPERRVFLIAYDDLNANLDTLQRRTGESDTLAALRQVTLLDHIDAILSTATTRLSDAVLEGRDLETADLEEPRRQARRLDPAVRRDLLLLQALYDTGEDAPARTRRIRRLLRLGPARRRTLWTAIAWGGIVLPAAVLVLFFTLGGGRGGTGWTVAFVAALVAWGALLFKRYVVDRYSVRRLARRLGGQLRMVPRSEDSWADALEQLDERERPAAALPITPSDEPRYAMLSRLRRVARALGFQSVVVVVDRIDEPTLISGDPERMRAVVWPLFNNKFLQQEGLGVKMLLPIELRYALFKESSAFFQEARLDKQSLIERLTWSGPMLYDLCTARLNACRAADAEPISLLELFAEDVSRQDLVDALDQMHQPRDAFKYLYRCLIEHCSNVTAEQNEWRIPRLVLETVRKQEVDRLQQLYRGIRPA